MNKLLILSASILAIAACKQEYVTYEQYGAVGDGAHDDQAAIIAAHAAANEKNLPVRAKDGATYYIGKGAEVAVIRTDVDFGTARFIIDDTETDNYKTEIFRVESAREPFAVNGVSSLKKGQTNLGVTLPCRSLVEVTDENCKVYIRRGLNQNSGTAKKELLLVEQDGTIADNAPVVWDYDNISSVKAWPIDNEKLTIRGGVFVTVANRAESQYNYRSRNLEIERSNVVVEGLSHYIVGEMDHGAPYSGFISIHRAAEVTVKDCLLTPHRTYSTIGSAGLPVSMGSYDMEASYCINVLFKGIRQTINIDDNAYWGLFASNFCKDLKMEDCVISRFDAHMGVCNVSLSDCKFGYMGVQMVGFGTARLENCEIHRNRMVWLRDDYGSCWDGDIVIRNCTVKLPGGNKLFLLDGSNDGHHDFGYDCRLPYSLDIDGLTIDDTVASDDYPGPFVFGTFNRNTNEADLIPFPSDCNVKLKNITVLSGRSLGVSPNEAMFSGASVN